MYSINIYRNQWLESYYLGDVSMLNFIESKDFYVKTNDYVIEKINRNKRIEKLVQMDKWHPEKFDEKNVTFNKINDTKYSITGSAFSFNSTINFIEEWEVENNRWKIISLTIL